MKELINIMKKKILFMVINMNVGGTEKALLNMISELPKDKFDITVLMLEKYGGFLNYIPSEVQVKYLEEYKNIKKEINTPPLKTIFRAIRSRKIVKAFIMAYLYLLSKIMKERSLFYKFILKGFPVVKNEYDVAVAYAGPMDFISYFILNKVNAKKKVQWIHFDINKIAFNKYFAAKIYKKFDKIFVVSNEGKEKLINRLPDLNDKTEVFTNLISSKLIKEEASKGKGFNDEFKGIRLVTVGRLSSEKGHDIAIKVLSRLIKDGLNVRWYCIGGGNLRKKYEELVDNLNLKSEFIFLGEDPNPYHYIKDCDIYVQPSRHEGYCITLAEARALQKPIVTTNFTGAKEQIKNKQTGLIVDVNEDQIYYAIKKLITNADLCQEFCKNLSKEKYDTYEIEKIFSLV
jgi:glycosyltransferase involved in cell wall biosynthesis